MNAPSSDETAKVLNIILKASLTAVFAIGGYMVLWAVNDAASRAEQTKAITALEQQVERGILPRSEERISALERRVDRLERETHRHGPRFDDKEDQ